DIRSLPVTALSVHLPVNIQARFFFSIFTGTLSLILQGFYTLSYGLLSVNFSHYPQDSTVRRHITIVIYLSGLNFIKPGISLIHFIMHPFTITTDIDKTQEG